jgi:hypothetical protein
MRTGLKGLDATALATSEICGLGQMRKGLVGCSLFQLVSIMVVARVGVHPRDNHSFRHWPPRPSPGTT